MGCGHNGGGEDGSNTGNGHLYIGNGELLNPASCQQAYEKGARTSGIYIIGDLSSGGSQNVWCEMTGGRGWTLVSRIVETSVKHMVPEAYGTLESVDQPKPWKLSDADINRLAAMSSLANPYRFDCDAVNTGAGVSSRSLPNLDAQYFSSDCTFVAYASVGSGACHDYYISAINTQTASSSNDCTPLQPMIEPRTHSSRAPGTQ